MYPFRSPFPFYLSFYLFVIYTLPFFLYHFGNRIFILASWSFQTLKFIVWILVLSFFLLNLLELLKGGAVMGDVVASHVPFVLHHLAAKLALHLTAFAVHVQDVLQRQKDGKSHLFCETFEVIKSGIFRNISVNCILSNH